MARKITAEDLLQIRTVSDPQIAPDGKRVACVVKHIDAEKNKYRGEIWMVPREGGEPRRFTGGDWSDSSPRWSPDGTRLAFLSDRQKPKSQIYVIAADGGEAQPLTKLEAEGGIQGLRWSPDGTRIAFLFRETPEAYRKEVTEERQKKELPAPPRVHKRLYYRLDGFGYYDDSYWQVWVADARTGEARQLTIGDYNCGAPVWSPDGQTLAFLSDRRDDADIEPERDEIWTVPVAGGELTRIPSPPGPKGALAWSPDGRMFAYVGNPDPEDQWGTNNQRLFVLSAEGGEAALDLTGPTDRTVGYLTLSDVHDVGTGDLIQWSSDSRRLFFPFSALGNCQLYFVEADGSGDPVLVTVEAEMGDFDVASDDRTFAVTLASSTTPQELYVFQWQDGTGIEAEAGRRFIRTFEITKTSFNREWRNEVQLVHPERLRIPNGEGGTVQGWLLRPPDFDPTQKYPLVLYVHGGPHMQYGNTLFHELQWLAAEGYVVLYTNPRGSKGYGEAHTKAIKGDWGGADFRDIMAAADYATGLDYVNAHRTAIMGGSYGGFMTAWAVGHTDRFTCAIADRLVANLHSMSGTDDFPWRHSVYFKGNAWDDPSDLWRCSPLAYAGRITTPLLLIHSDGDLRCPVGQAEELFAALRLQRKTVEFVRYPAETSHGLSRNGPPNLRLDRLRRNLEWLNRWLKAE
ncbi:MAG TPA: S9 family peptidase [Chthonomonadaceae bacterium]|nr:S9 family peptidase [Chthonomonadaceae bacterium]